ncbi:type IV secretory system conjugative DNA transfer family protein [Marivita sp. S0852]|uniref:type IV secretory system conjugative DNA transfer family protein n=1 Tax=Marivita sp. S0852 TaxID=3373893 RepID=UPI00398293A7
MMNAAARKQRRDQAEVTSGIYGEADFASLDDCEAAGLLDPNGLYLGTLDGEPLFFSGKSHLLTVAPARQGKGIGTVIPNLLHFQGAVIVTDPKGELAAVTAQHRAERFGQKVVVLNPWGLNGLPQQRINPLQELIYLASDVTLQRGLTDKVKAIALQLLPEPEDQKNRFFREGSRTAIRFVLLALAMLHPERCTLPEVWRVLANQRKLRELGTKARESMVLGGVLSELADDLLATMEDSPDQFADFRTGAVQALDVYAPGGYLADAVSGSGVDLADLKNGDVSVYLAFPQERIASHGAALGLIVNEAISAVSRADGAGEVLFMLDEFANLGKLDGLAGNLTGLPGLGIRLWMVVQELAELTRLYGPNTAKTILSQSEVQQFFAVNDHDLAEKLSKRMGQRTVKTRSLNLGKSEDEDIGESLGETGQPLMRPEEIMQMDRSDQLIFAGGGKPIRAQRPPFWFVDPWQGWAESNPVEGDYPKPKPLFSLRYGLNQRGENDDE